MKMADLKAVIAAKRLICDECMKNSKARRDALAESNREEVAARTIVDSYYRKIIKAIDDELDSLRIQKGES